MSGKVTVTPTVGQLAPQLLAPATAVDRFIGLFSPRRQLERQRYRAAIQFFGGGSYDGARSDRKSLKHWNPGAHSADRDTVGDLPTLRGRSRDLVRNAPIATGAINTWVTNTIGTGLQLHAAIDREYLGLSDAEADAWERDAERYWRCWAETTLCDVTGQDDFYGLQDQFFRGTLESGDIFAFRRFRGRPGSLFRTQVQLVEADRVSNPDQLFDTDKLVAGVELDQVGQAVAYHVANRHPGEFSNLEPITHVRMPVYGRLSKERIALHGMKRMRPGSTRGVPILAPVIETLKQLSRYTEAEVTAAVVSAFFTVFVTSPPLDDGTTGGIAPLPDDENTGVTDKAGELGLAPGGIFDLAPGEGIESADPKRPNSQFDPFMTAVSRHVGAAIEIPFEILIKHFTASYSASRAALLEAWRAFRTRRKWVTRVFNRPCYEWVITEAIDAGYLRAPGYFLDPLARQAWLGSTWTGPAPGQLDPKKEMEGASMRIAEDVSTRSEVTAEITGNDWEQTVVQRAREERMRADLGLAGSGVQTSATASAEDERTDELDMEDFEE